MITDAQNRPSNQQSLIGTGVTIVSTDSIDLLTANRNVGRSFASRMFAALTTALAGGTSVQAQLIESANANLSSPTVLASGPVITTANGVAGAEILDVPIPGTTKRYLGTQYIIVGAMSAGAVTAVAVSETDNQPYITMNTGL
jgi:hypothetical protein